MSRRPVGVGVVGAGVISDQYLDNLTRAADVAVLMVADLDTDRAAARATQFDVPASGTLDELLAHPDVELVVNLTVPAAHVPVGLAAVAAGKHVYSEKPFALDRSGGQELLGAADLAGLRAACAPDTVLGAGVQTARRLIEAGAIGEPLTGLALFQVSGPETWHPSPEFLFAKGGGPLFDMGPYYFSALLQCLGPATRVVARGSRSRTERVVGQGPRAGTVFPVEVPTHVAGLIDFAAGGSATAVLSFQSALQRSGVVEITGTEGVLALPDPNGFDGTVRLWRTGHEEPESIPAVGSTMTRGQGVVELARALGSGPPGRLNGRLGLHLVDLMCSLEESASHGEQVQLSTTAEPAPTLPEDWDPYARTL
ncbi:MAG TPA: Gfo/Idh/MocA family oxidoreductase [Actinotalea sp.]|nr:Gfo/Idh/MocA family oxidoreductase [Actinotalea sp.]